jgi:hypothetical protein
MKALSNRFNRSLQPPSPPLSQQTNFASQRGHVSVRHGLPAIKGSQLQLSSYRFQRQIESAFQNYQRQTGFNLVDHPLAERLQGCTSVRDAVDILREQARVGGIDDFFGGNCDGRLMKSLIGIVCVLHKLSTSTVLREVTGLVRQRMQIGVSYL